MIRLLTAAAVVLAMSPGTAQAACFAPTAPYCTNSTALFADDAEADGCYNEMVAYYDALKAHDACLQREMDAFAARQSQQSDAAWAVYTQALETFKRRNGQ